MLKRLLRYGLLIGILLALVPLKQRLDFRLGYWSHDAAYYYTIARYFSEGAGLRSNISLYFQGFQSFPHRVTTSPVWPATLGAMGRLFGIERVSTPLPATLYFVALVLLYFLARRLRSGIAGNRKGGIFRDDRVPDFGHVAVAVFATNVVFFRYSHVPNNEPLAFSLMFLAFLSLDRAARGHGPSWAATAGFFAGAALLTRPQTIPLFLGIPLVLTWFGFSDRSGRRLAPAALVGALVPLVPWVIYLATWDALTFKTAIGLETQHETPMLEPFSQIVETETLWDFVVDRLGGLLVAFHPSSKRSYVTHFSLLAYLVPATLLYFTWRLTRSRFQGVTRLPAHLVMPVTMILAGAGMLIPVHLFHFSHANPWLFGFRHGLPLLLLILPALAYLDTHAGRLWRLGATAVLVASLFMSVTAILTLTQRGFRTGISPVEQELVQWLDRQLLRPSVVTTFPWHVGAFSRSGYHWTHCNERPATTMALLLDARADYVLVFNKDRHCNFVRGLEPRFLKQVKTFGQAHKQVRVLAVRDRVEAMRWAEEAKKIE